MRKSETGATRNNNEGKLPFYKFINIKNDYSFANYMQSHRIQADGKLRDGDNWQKGLNKEWLIDSLTRHVKELELLHAGYFVYHISDKYGEHTEYFKEPVNWFECPGKVYASLVTLEECLNAIRFNSEAYKLQILN